MTGLIGLNGLSTSWEYDDFGRQLREIRADGTTTALFRSWCSATSCQTGGALKLMTLDSSSAPVVLDTQL